eukprot:2281011-Pyramimonas_sp.AAC.1
MIPREVRRARAPQATTLRGSPCVRASRAAIPRECCLLRARGARIHGRLQMSPRPQSTIPPKSRC